MAETYSIYWGTSSGNLSLIASDISDLFYPMPIEGVLDYNTTFFWRIDATNEFGTTEGTEWYFATIVFTPPIPTYDLVSGGNGNGPPGVDDPPGVEGVDWVWTGLNSMVTTRRLVAAAKNAIFYEWP